jgi:hypothetical protein
VHVPAGLRRPAAAAKPSRPGRNGFSIKAGQTKTVKVPLTKTGKGLMRKRKRPSAFLNVRLTSKRAVSKRLTLRG